MQAGRVVCLLVVLVVGVVATAPVRRHRTGRLRQATVHPSLFVETGADDRIDGSDDAGGGESHAIYSQALRDDFARPTRKAAGGGGGLMAGSGSAAKRKADPFANAPNDFAASDGFADSARFASIATAIGAMADA